MTWQSFLDTALPFLRDHWLKFLSWLFLLIIGTWWGKRRARAEWTQKRFLDRINFSLNILQNNKLQIRTLAEKNCRDVFLNEIAAERILAAANHTTAENPILPLRKDDRWYYLNAVLNEVSEQFALGFLKRDMNIPVQTQAYLVCLTYESSGELKTRKIRAMVIRKDVLTNLPAEPPQFERPHHATRWITLHQLAKSYTNDASNFLEVEISI